MVQQPHRTAKPGDPPAHRCCGHLPEPRIHHPACRRGPCRAARRLDPTKTLHVTISTRTHQTPHAPNWRRTWRPPPAHRLTKPPTSNRAESTNRYTTTRDLTLTPPSDRSLAGGPVTFHLAAAVAAWSVLWHWVTEPPLLSTLRQPHRGLSDDGPDIRLQSIYFQR